MKVLHLSNTPLSNAPHNLMVSQNQYGVESRLLLHRSQNLNKILVGNGELWLNMKKEEIVAALEAADVIHFHNFAKELNLFTTYPEFWKLIEKKPKLIQYHSPRKTIENFEPSISDKTLKHAVIAQYHTRVYPECEFIVPNVVPLFQAQYSPLSPKWEQRNAPVISYAPSNITLGGWDNKGYEVTRRVLLESERENWSCVEILIGVPYTDCMIRKRWAHLGIDEVMTGSYHLSGLEYLAMGCVTFGYLDKLTQEAIRTVVNSSCGEGDAAIATLPWVQVDHPDELKKIMYRTIVAGQGNARAIRWEELKQKAQQSREWMEKYWNPQNHVRWFSRIYEQL